MTRLTHSHVKAIEQRLREFTNTSVCFVVGALEQSGSGYASERQLMRQATEKRQREFYSGRHLARLALHRAGVSPTALLRGPLGNPLWPPSVVGSITHDHTFGAAAVSLASSIQGLGLDLIEDPHSVTDDLAKLIMHPDEALHLKALYPELPSTGLAFSLKEAVVKAVSVHLGRYMDLLEIRLEPHNQALAARVDGLSPPLPCMALWTDIGLLSCCTHFR